MSILIKNGRIITATDNYVADIFIERAQEGIEGRAHMNCSLCKYRVQIVGFERQQEFEPPIISSSSFLPTDNGDSLIRKPLETKYFSKE